MSYRLPDCPAVQFAEAEGWRPEGVQRATKWRVGPENEPKMPVCPVCGEMCENIYYVDDEIAGCEACIKIKDAREVDECFAWA